MKILILFAHPAFQKSRVNKALIVGLKGQEHITFHDLYEAYPDFDIDIKYEQDLLLQHDCIIFQHPMFWYSAPALLKEWMDLVLEHGWAYGSKGSALKNKLFFSAVSTGAGADAFHPNGLHLHCIKEFLLPIYHSAQFCHLLCLPPFVVHGSFGLQAENIHSYKIAYHQLLNLIATNQLNVAKASQLTYLNDYLNREEN